MASAAPDPSLGRQRFIRSGATSRGHRTRIRGLRPAASVLGVTAPLRLHGGALINVSGEVSTGGITAVSIMLATWLIGRGSLNAQTKAGSGGEFASTLGGAIEAILAPIKDNGIYDCVLEVKVFDTCVMFTLHPTDTGMIFVKSLGDRAIPFGWRKKSFDLIVEGLNLAGAGVMTAADVRERHVMWQFEDAETDEEAIAWLMESYNVDESEVVREHLPSQLTRALPDIERSSTRPRRALRVNKAPPALQALWIDAKTTLQALRLAVAGMSNQSLFADNELVPDQEDLTLEPGAALFACDPQTGPWCTLYDEIYCYWMQGDNVDFIAGRQFAVTPDDCEQILGLFLAQAEVLRTTAAIVDYWLELPYHSTPVNSADPEHEGPVP